MRIAHNLSSLNTARLIGISEKKLGNAIEKLSSGYRINSASDDAAGLSISEKMRGQIRGLRQAARNAQDGISVIQTAEGALNEIHNILQRIHELSIQAANDTDTPDDRGKIQKEINELVKEVDNISNNTEFNTKKLLDGTLAPKTAKINPALSSRAAVRVTPEATSDMVSGNLKLIYMEQTDSFETVRSDDGNATIPGNSYLKNVLQTEIVPQAVKSILSAFSPAFNYLSSSTIGIGLNLYSDSSSSVLASAKVAYGISGNRVESTMLEYQLAVNMSSLAFDADGKLTGESRNALETTIIHEMVHTFMDEALTNGMIG
ncbi:MAG TPA: flagellin, partial [Ruminiclostridium sp.]|nr:flagellin [Ruminiclostridium sp.]